MLIATPEKVCYMHLAASKAPITEGDIRHRYLCSGYNNGSLNGCPEFVSVASIQRGICAYEQRANNGFGDTLIKSVSHSCKECNSNHDSGKNPDSEERGGCTGYTPMLDVIKGTCAWHIRSGRLLDLYHGDRSQLKPEELHCLKKCSATKAVSCEGYVNVKHVVNQTCAHKVDLDNKLRKGGEIEGELESICNGCNGDCKSVKCNGGYISITEKHHFEAINDMHPLIIGKKEIVILLQQLSPSTSSRSR